MRAKNIARVIVNSAADRPWSQYFCCMIAGNRDFVRKNPIATKRAMRAILKAANICTVEPERSAKSLVEKWYPTNYDYALQVIGTSLTASGASSIPRIPCASTLCVCKRPA